MSEKRTEMEKHKLVVSLLLICTAVFLPSLAQSTADSPRKVANWFNALPAAKEKKTHLHFYFHDIVSGKNPTAIRIVNPPDTVKYRTQFGFVNMMDDPLTVGPDPGSEPIGRAQGFYGSACQESFGLLMYMNLVLTGKEFNGSTLSVLGRNSALDTYREMSIVGGTGVFRVARGIATAKTFYINFTSGDAVVEYNVFVLHY